MIWGGRKTKDLVVYVKVNWHPLTHVWDKSSAELTATLFICLSYAQNRTYVRDFFNGVSSARLPSEIHILRNSLLQRTMTEISIPSGQSIIQRHIRLKCRLGPEWLIIMFISCSRMIIPASKSALGDRDRNIIKTVLIIRCNNCLRRLKRNGRDRKLLRGTLHGEVRETKEKRNNKNWREDRVKPAKDGEERWTCEEYNWTHGRRECVWRNNTRGPTEGNSKKWYQSKWKYIRLEYKPDWNQREIGWSWRKLEMSKSRIYRRSTWREADAEEAMTVSKRGNKPGYSQNLKKPTLMNISRILSERHSTSNG